MKQITSKINKSSNKINNEDIIIFINTEIKERNLDDYFDMINTNASSMSISKSSSSDKYVINTNFEILRKSIEERLFSLPSFKAAYEKQFIFSRSKFIDKMISIIFLFLTLHEIEHIEHIRKINEGSGFEADLLRDISDMLKINPYHAIAISHDHLPDEIMADIEALKRLYYLESNNLLNISDFEKKLFNEFVAQRLYSAYTVENEFYSVDLGDHPAPLEYIDYLAKTRLNMKTDFDFMNYVNSLDYNIDDIKYGKKIDVTVINQMFLIKSGKISSLNLITDLEKSLLNSKSKTRARL